MLVAESAPRQCAWLGTAGTDDGDGTREVEEGSEIRQNNKRMASRSRWESLLQ